jgi:hypothetical protein
MDFPRMSRRAPDFTLVILSTLFLLPSTFQLRAPAVPVGDFYLTFVELCIFALLLQSGLWLGEARPCGCPSPAR